MLAVAISLAGCSSSGSPRAVVPPTPSSTGLVDAYTALAPPGPGTLGGFDALTVGHAQEVVHGLLAEQLLEPGTLTGAASIAADLAGAVGDLRVARDLGRRPVARGLAYRPLFPAPLRLGTPPAKVTVSTWSRDVVQGAGGETGLRISWTGSLSYAVTTPDGVAHQVGYRTRLGYIFSPRANEPSGVALQQVQAGSATTTGALASCRVRGLLWPGTSGPCPVAD